MRQLIITLTLIGISVNQILAQDLIEYNSLIDSAHAAITKGDNASALDFYVKAFSFDVPQDPNHLYEAAVMAARLQQKDRAFMFLNWAVTQGFSMYDHALKNKEFPQFKDVRFDRLLEKMRVQDSVFTTLSPPLDSVFQSDVQIRTQFLKVRAEGNDSIRQRELLTEMNKIDSVNLVKVREMIFRYGFLSKSLKTDGARNAMWLVIQHSPLEVREEYLPIIKRASERGEISPAFVAIMEDRNLMQKYGKQNYGSQYSVVDGKVVIAPLYNPEAVDSLRKQVGLDSLSEYIEMVEKGLH